jgi:hypothetical protein
LYNPDQNTWGRDFFFIARPVVGGHFALLALAQAPKLQSKATSDLGQENSILELMGLKCFSFNIKMRIRLPQKKKKKKKKEF